MGQVCYCYNYNESNIVKYGSVIFWVLYKSLLNIF